MSRLIGYLGQLGNALMGRGDQYSVANRVPGSSDNPQEKGEYGEEAHSGPAGVKFPNFMPFWDEQQSLYETELMRLAYRKMLSSPYVKAPICAKIFGVAALDLVVNPADKKSERQVEMAEFMTWMLTKRLHGGIPGLVWSVLSGGLVDGVSVCEPVWTIQDTGRYRGRDVLRVVKAKDIVQDMVLETDSFRNLTGIRGLRYNAGVVWAPEDFMVFRHMPMFDNPVGMSDLRAAYQFYWYLDTTTKLRALAAQNRAIPILVGEYPDSSKLRQVETMLGLVKSRAWAAVPTGVKLTALAAAQGAEEFFKSACQDWAEAIVLSIEGATLQVMAAAVGKERGDTTVHKDSADLRKWYLSACFLNLLNDHENGLIRRGIDRNYLDVNEYPYATMGGVDDRELVETLNIDKGLQEMGFKHRSEDIAERYGRKEATNEEEELKKPEQPGPGGQAPGDPFGGGNGPNGPAGTPPREDGPIPAPARPGDKGGNPNGRGNPADNRGGRTSADHGGSGPALFAEGPEHAPAGSPKGGQFLSKGGGGHGGESSKPSKAPAVKGEMSGAKRVGKGKESKVVLADGSDAPPHIKPSMVPPNWTDVKVGLDPSADVLVTGRDKAGRPKTVYADSFHARNAAVKFDRTQEMLKKAKALHEQNQNNRKDPKLREHADCTWLMMEQATRPGSDQDTKAKVKAFGATTLLGEHVVEAPDGVRLQFVGKEGVHHDHLIRNPELAAMLLDRKRTAEKRGGKLFNTDYDKVREYARQLDGGRFSPKDFRTKRANELAIAEISKHPEPPKSDKEYKARVNAVAKAVSQVLGNKPAQCLESYLDPIIFSGWKVAS